MNPNSDTPIQLFFRNVFVQTSGSPVDVGVVDIPKGIERFSLSGGAGSGWSMRCIGETLSGDASPAQWQIFDAPNGAGNLVSGATPLSGPTTNGVFSVVAGGLVASTARKLYLRQIGDSAHGGKVTIGFWCVPFNE